MWLRLGKTKNKLSPTWRQEEKESNPSWIQKDTGQDKTWRQRKMVRENVSTVWRQKKKENKCTSCTWIWSADKKCYDVTTEIYHSHK